MWRCNHHIRLAAFSLIALIPFLIEESWDRAYLTASPALLKKWIRKKCLVRLHLWLKFLIQNGFLMAFLEKDIQNVYKCSPIPWNLSCPEKLLVVHLTTWIRKSRLYFITAFKKIVSKIYKSRRYVQGETMIFSFLLLSQKSNFSLNPKRKLSVPMYI